MVVSTMVDARHLGKLGHKVDAESPRGMLATSDPSLAMLKNSRAGSIRRVFRWAFDPVIQGLVRLS